MTLKKYDRREFLKKAATVSAGTILGTTLFSAKSYGRIIGANDRVNFAVAGLNGRGGEHIAAINACENSRVAYLCDVDSRALEKGAKRLRDAGGGAAKAEKDIRKILEDKSVDAVAIATPDHWHAPMAIMSMQAGKHVYLEKPSSHNPAEGEVLLKAQKKYGKLVQMGNQQRSSPHTIEIIRKIREGIIGDVYFGKAWYSNSRGSIGVGKEAAVPDYLDWDLWQGPAPRVPYKDNYHPYNWHWFWHWGTGETLNNGTHEVDLCLWALGLERYPEKVTAAGGRYHFQDDWEFYDTMVTSFEFGNKLITWEGKSCNSKLYYGRGRGVTIHGTRGTVLLDRNGYELEVTGQEKVIFVKEEKDASTDIRGGGPLTDAHFQNFINGITDGESLRSPVSEGNLSVTMLQLSNIAWAEAATLKLDKETGHILDNEKAAARRFRSYEPGWEPKI